MKFIRSFEKISAHNLTLIVLSLITLGTFSLGSATTAFASPIVVSGTSSHGGYKYIGKTTDSYGVTFALSACKINESANIVVNSSYSISPVNPTTVAHSSIWQAYSNTKDPNYLDYTTANLTAFNSNGTATDSYTASKSVKTFLYWEGDYNPNGSGFSNAGSGVAIPSPFKPFNIKKLYNC